MNESFSDALLSYTNKYYFKQVFSQHILGPELTWNGTKPEEGSEVYIYNLPYDLMPSEIISLFEYFGEIYQFRFLLTFSGASRKFCFCRYMKVVSAKRAIEVLNRVYIRPGVSIFTVPSRDNRILLLNNINKDLTYEDIKRIISSNLDNIKRIFFNFKNRNSQKNYGLLYLEFTTHRAAQMAFSRLQFLIRETIIQVRWARIHKN